MMVVMVGLGVKLLFLGHGALELADPSGGSGDLLEVEQVGVEQTGDVDVGIVGIDDLGLGLDHAYDLADAAQLFRSVFDCIINIAAGIPLPETSAMRKASVLSSIR